MQSDSDFDHFQEVCAFRDYLKENEFEGYNKSGPHAFTPKATLQKYFKEQRGRLESLLRKTLSADDFLAISTESVLEEYIVVFATLMTIGKPKFLRFFVAHGLCDDRLPIESEPLHFKFPTCSDGIPLFPRFEEAQWRFCPFKFRKNDSDYHIRPKYVLPICSRIKIRRRPPATVYKVEIHRDCDPFHEWLGLNPRSSAYPKHTYVFKEFHGAHATNAYRKELLAFLHLQRTARHQLGRSIIGFFGSFIHGDTPTIILEFADHGTLEEFLQTKEAPQDGEDTIHLWNALFTLSAALYTIHNIHVGHTYSDTDRNHSILRGYHQDIKPTNILVVSGSTDSEYDFEFRLADLGTSHFARIEDGTNDDLFAADAGGTKEYGAPECYQSGLLAESSSRIQQGVDVWSLGCVFSEFGVWMVSGLTRLNQYRKARRSETADLELTDPGCFHDGQGAPLTCVQVFHDRACEDTRRSDHVTGEVLSMMVPEMLGEDSDSRPSSKLLVRKSEKIIKDARKKLENHRNSTVSKSMADLPRTPSSRERRATRSQTNPAVTAGQRTAGPVIAIAASRDQAEIPNEISSSPPQMSDEEDMDVLEAQPSAETPFTSPASSAYRGHKRGTRNNSYNTHAHQQHTQVPRYSPPGASSPCAESFLPRQERFIDSTTNSIHQNYEVRHGLDGAAHYPGAPYAAEQRVSQLPSPYVPSHFASNSTSNPSPAPPQTTPSTPYLSIDTLYKRYSNRKSGIYNPPLEDDDCLRPFDSPKRDFVFLLDDSKSMHKYAHEVVKAVKSLAWMLKKYDSDGIELCFMRSPERKQASAGRSKDLHPTLVSCMLKAQGNSDITNRLGSLLHDYTKKYRLAQKAPSALSQLFSSHSKVKALMIYVITDGVWEKMCDPAPLIKDTARILDQHNAPQNQIGIQFISVHATDADLAKLQHLDSGLGIERDMVDTEPIDGNVFKMLLGPISRTWDDDKLQPSEPRPG